MKKQMQRTSSQFNYNTQLRMHEVKIHLTIELITLFSPGSERLLMSRSKVKVVPLSLKIKPFNQFPFFNDRLEAIKTMLAVWPGIVSKTKK